MRDGDIGKAASHHVPLRNRFLGRRRLAFIFLHAGRGQDRDALTLRLLVIVFGSGFGRRGDAGHACRQLGRVFGVVRIRGKVFPLAPPVKVDEGLHAAPLFDLALQPDEVDGL